jgi:pyruvate kinase
MDKKTKIVATLGPASWSKEMILKLRKAGMNVSRLNFSHGKYEEFAEMIKHIREIEKEENLPTAILQDLQGPKIRLGNLLQEPVILVREQKVVLCHAKEQHDDRIPVQIDIFPSLSVGSHILINDGLVRLRVDSLGEHEAHCTVLAGGEIKSHKGVNLPDTQLPNLSLTEKDKEDLQFGLEQKVDFVALSFVQTAEDVKHLRSIIEKHTHHPKIVVKLETGSAVKHLEEIIAETDAVMVARGDMAVEVGQEEVPLIQRKIIALGRKYNKPVIVATQMLESMIKNAEPTRAEVNDIATAVLDQVDAVMLSAESATGDYPVEAVSMMDRIIRRVERYHEQQHEGYMLSPVLTHPSQTASVAAAACVLAHQLKAKEIVALTASGITGLYISSYRPLIPLHVLTDNVQTYHQLNLAWGVTPHLIEKIEDNRKAYDHFISSLEKQQVIASGDKIVVVAGSHPGSAGHTNEISVTEVGGE